MIKTKFDYAIEFTLPWETGREKDGSLRKDGGYNMDDGSPTKYGIRAAANPTVDIANLTLDAAYDIYRTKYWNSANLDKYELGLSCVMFDTGVNCGTGRMMQWYNKIKDEKNPALMLIQRRDQHYLDLSKKDPDRYKKFLKGWLARTNDLRKYIDIIRNA